MYQIDSYVMCDSKMTDNSYERGPVGRPRSLDNRRKRLILLEIARGASFAAAASCADCHRDTLIAERRRDPLFDAAVVLARQWRGAQPRVEMPREGKSAWRSAARFAEYEHAIKRQAREMRRFEEIVEGMKFTPARGRAAK